MNAYKTAITNLNLEEVVIGNGPAHILCDISTGTPRPIVPKSHRRQIFDSIHKLSHPSIRTAIKLISDRFVWHDLRREVGEWARTCVSCQKAKVQRHVQAPLEQYENPPHRFATINIDIVGPLPISQGFSYLFTIVDRFTRWPEAIPMTDATATSCAQALALGWISRFGIPQKYNFRSRTAIHLTNLERALANLGFSIKPNNGISPSS